MGDTKETIDTVQVALRIRPLMQMEIDRGCDQCIDVVPGQPQVQIKDLAFTYNHVFPQHITQQEFYDTSVKLLINKLFQGYNATILAYGQTGSGKTFTMGTNYSGSQGDSTKLGVIPLAVADIFNFVATHEDEFIFKITVSFMELYKEQCFDLLSGKERSHSAIEIREDRKKGVILPGITEVPVTSTMKTMKLLERGSRGRVTGSTAMNQESSRSHAVFTIVITKESRTNKNNSTTSKFHLVDLAGSERIKKTKATGERMREGVKINQGLFSLGNVISALGDGTNRKYISYRDSKLTRLLQDSLGGNSLTLMVACVSPADYNLEETVSTLRYADRARRIKNKPIVNQDAKAAEIIRLNNLVNHLQLQLIENSQTTSETKIEQVADEPDHELARYTKLLKKHKEVTEHLCNIIVDNTNLCEKALLAESANLKIERKLNTLIEQCNQRIENLNTTDAQDDDHQKTDVVGLLKEFKLQLEDVRSVSVKSNEEIMHHELGSELSSFTNDDNDHTDDGVNGVVLNEDQAVLEEEKMAMEQVVLNRELQELNQAMAMKASVVQGIHVNNNNLRENEEKISQLEKERDELMQLLKQTESKDPSRQVGRSQVSALEDEIRELKKKCQSQADIINTKNNNDAKIKSLNAELQTMKATKIQIIKRMREKNEKFRKWKADNERAMFRLRDDDRKHTTAMDKMESLHANQQKVLKRKMEEILGVNKRLKEALERQKQLHVKCKVKGTLKADAVQQYIEQELELQLSIVEAETSLSDLMEYRAWTTERIKTLCNSPNVQANSTRLEALENDLAMRNAQISDLQHKIITADQDSKSRKRWDSIQSMLEAKMTLRCLFELLVGAKRELASQSEKGFQARYEHLKEAYDRVCLEFELSSAKFERKIATVKIESEKKLAALTALHRCDAGASGGGDACRMLESVIKEQQVKLDVVEAERKSLSEQLESLSVQRTTQVKRRKQLTRADAFREMELEPTDEEDGDDDRIKDADWLTPLYWRIQAQRRAKNFSSSSGDQSDD